MALYLNLYHEIQKQKLKRQRDPMKIAIAALLLVAIGFIGYYFWRVEVVKRARTAAAQIQSKWASLQPQAKQADTDKLEYDQNITLADYLTHKIENRFYWAPLLQELIDVVPPEVQITGLDGSISTDGTKRVTVTLSGMSSGTQPRAVAEELRVAVQNKLAATYRQAAATFRSLDDGPEPVIVQGKSAPTAVFIIDVTFSSPDITETDKLQIPVAKK